MMCVYKTQFKVQQIDSFLYIQVTNRARKPDKFKQRNSGVDKRMFANIVINLNKKF